MFVLPTFGLGVIGSPTVPPGTFDTATLVNGGNGVGNDNALTFTVNPSASIGAGSTLTIAGLTGSQTADSGSLTIGGAGASIFGSSGSWTQSSGTLVLTVAGGQSVPTGSDTVITFTLTNPATTNAGVTGITLASSGFTTADISGTFLNAVAIFNVTTRDTEANIKISTPTNPSGEVNIAFGEDTNDFYIYDGSDWYVYNNFNNNSVSLDGTNDYVTATLGSQVFDGDFTLSFWFNADTAPTYTTLMQSGSNSGYNDGFRIYRYANTSLAFWKGQGGYSNIFGNIGTTATGSWHHVVVTRSGTTSTFYLNGSSIDTGTDSQSYTSTAFQIGFTTYPFDGLIDEVALWDSSLSSSNVTTIYSGGVPSDLSGLSPVNWWRMGDNNGGKGTTVTDQGSAGNNASLLNGAAFSTSVP
jgi:hypothetical protein